MSSTPNKKNDKVIYHASKHAFTNFASFVEKLNVTHHSLPEIFLNRDEIDIISNAPTVSFQMAAKQMETNVYRTTFFIKIDCHVKCKNKQTQEDSSYHIYSFEMEYAAFTQIDKAETLTEIERKQILVVDVPYLVFPAIRHLIFFLTENMKSMPVQLNQIHFEELFQQELLNPTITSDTGEEKNN